MTEPISQTCEHCRHCFIEGVNKETLQKYLICRRFPPTASLIPGPDRQPMTLGVFPPVQAHHSCGEWQLGKMIFSGAN